MSNTVPNPSKNFTISDHIDDVYQYLEYIKNFTLHYRFCESKSFIKLLIFEDDEVYLNISCHYLTQKATKVNVEVKIKDGLINNLSEVEIANAHLDAFIELIGVSKDKFLNSQRKFRF